MHHSDVHVSACNYNFLILNDTIYRTVDSNISGNISCPFVRSLQQSSKLKIAHCAGNGHSFVGNIFRMLHLHHPNNNQTMEAVEWHMQVALSLTGCPHRNEAQQSRHSLRISASRQQLFERLLSGDHVPQLRPLPSASLLQLLGLYHLVNPSQCFPKSLPTAGYIPQYVGATTTSMLVRTASNVVTLKVSIPRPHHKSRSVTLWLSSSACETSDGTAIHLK